MKKFYRSLFLLSVIVSACTSSRKNVATQTLNTVDKSEMKYNFGLKSIDGYVQVTPLIKYTTERGYGIDLNSAVVEKEGFITGNKPFYFSVKLAEGNYNVSVKLGDKNGTSDAAIRAENRRMMVNRLQTKKGELSTIDFTVHIRDTIIRNSNGNSKVRIKPRERVYHHWDDKLTLEFNGAEPKVATIEIKPADKDVVTIFLAGNSTVVDQAEEPYAAWGQMIPAYFKPKKVVVANYAESGESLSSFISAKRFEKVLSLMKSGDYAFVEFGHNDMKQKGEGIGAFTSYKKDLKFFIAEVKKKGGYPVLVTSMQRRSFNTEGKIIETLGDYPAAVRQTAQEENVPLIDLNAMSKIMYEAWGEKESLKAFVHFPANSFPNQKVALADNTHFTPYGANQIAQIILKGIRENVPGLSKFIKPGVPGFDPAKPELFESFYWPNSSSATSVKPDGN